MGDDVNPCSRSAPCKTFAGAISKTAAGGEINCLDPDGFGTLTVTKSITVDCTGTFGSTLNSGGINGFTINDRATLTPRTIKVILRGISINGAGSTPGLNGIRFISGASLVVENVFIQNQLSGSGISVAPSAGTAQIEINNTQVVNSGATSGVGAGLSVAPTGSGAASVSVTNSSFDRNSNGILATVAGTSGEVRLGIADSSMSNNTQNGFSGTGGLLRAMGTKVNASYNGGTGIATTSGASIRIGSSTVTGNSTGLSGNVRSFGNNQISLNTTNGAPTAVDALE